MTAPTNRVERLLHLEPLLDEFEAALADGLHPSLADFVSRASTDCRDRALAGLLALEVDYRRAAGEQPTAEEYLSQFPNDVDVIRREFAAEHQTQMTGTANESTASALLPSPARRTLPDRIDDYELLQEIARGGMGVVYKARQVSLDRIVAVKLIRGDESISSEYIDRFLVEQRAAAALRHQGIVAIHAAGLAGGQHFFSMEFVDGESLAGKTCVSEEAARIVRDAARAVHHAHQHGVLHRDLKPSNILLDRDGNVRITDFGLAKRTTTQGHELTATGQILGTPSYMSPEQAQGEPEAIDRRSDVYSLGAVLYALLTGRPPHLGKTMTATLLSVAQQAPRRPRELNAAVDADLERICLKCLEKSPAARFATADDLAIELDRYLDRRAQAALAAERQPSASRRRVRTAVGVIGAALVLLAALLIVVATDNGQLVIETNDPQVEVAVQQKAVKIHDRAGKRSYDLRAGSQRMRSGEYTIAVTEESGLKFETTEFRIERSGTVAIKAWLKPVMDKPADATADLVKSTTRTQPSLPAKTSASEITTAAPKLTLVREYKVLSAHPWRIAVSPDGKRCYAGDAARNIVCWDVETADQKFICHHEASVYTLALTSDGRYLVSGSADKTVRCWDALTGEPVRNFETDTKWCWGLAVSPDGQWVVGDSTNSTSVWNLATGQRRAKFPIDAGAFAILPNNREYLYGNTKSLEWRSLETGDLIREYAYSGGWVRCVALSRDGKYAVTGHGNAGDNAPFDGDDCSVRLWDLSQDKPLRRLDGFQRSVFGLSFSPEGDRFVAASLDGSLRVYQTSDGAELHVSQGLSPMYDVAFTPDGQHVVTGDKDNTLRLWKLPPAALLD